MPKWRLRGPTRPVREFIILPWPCQAQTLYTKDKGGRLVYHIPVRKSKENDPPIFGPASPYHYSKLGGACQALSFHLTPPPVYDILVGVCQNQPP